MTSDSDNLEKVRGLLQLIDSGVSEPEVIDSLHAIIRDDPEANQFYIRQMHLRASLWWYLTDEKQDLTENTTSYSSLPAEPVRIVYRRKFYLVGIISALILMVGLSSYFLMPYLKPSPQIVGEISKFVDVIWEPNAQRWAEKAKIFPGDQIHIQQGIVEVELVSGTKIILEGPALFTIVDSQEVKLQAGNLFAHVPQQAIGFSVTTPASRILDLGTEFGVVVDQTGKTDVHVIKGQLEVGLLGSLGKVKESRLLEMSDAVRLQPSSSRIANIDFQPRIFTKELDYESVIQEANPFVYFQFNQLEKGIVRNQAGNHHHLQLIGNVRLQGEGSKKALRFDRSQQASYARLTEPVSHLISGDYTVELWVRPSALKHSTLVSIKHLKEGQELIHAGPDVGLFELMDYRARWFERLTGLRWMLRLPPTSAIKPDGNVHSHFKYQLGQWYHIVGVRSGDELRLYIDGELQGTTKYGAKTSEKVAILIGCDLSTQDLSAKPKNPRAFIGEIDELMIYQRALTDTEIQNHYRLFQSN